MNPTFPFLLVYIQRFRLVSHSGALPRATWLKSLASYEVLQFPNVELGAGRDMYDISLKLWCRASPPLP